MPVVVPNDDVEVVESQRPRFGLTLRRPPPERQRQEVGSRRDFNEVLLAAMNAIASTRISETEVHFLRAARETWFDESHSPRDLVSALFDQVVVPVDRSDWAVPPADRIPLVLSAVSELDWSLDPDEVGF